MFDLVHGVVVVSDRFEARSCDHTWGWGVWDTFDRCWLSENRMMRSAEAGAAWLNKRQVPVRPPKPAEVWMEGEWVPAHLLHWSHEPDGSWRGWAILEGRPAARWYPGDRLRPMRRDPTQ